MLWSQEHRSCGVTAFHALWQLHGPLQLLQAMHGCVAGTTVQKDEQTLAQMVVKSFSRKLFGAFPPTASTLSSPPLSFAGPESTPSMSQATRSMHLGSHRQAKAEALLKRPAAMQVPEQGVNNSQTGRAAVLLRRSSSGLSDSSLVMDNKVSASRA